MVQARGWTPSFGPALDTDGCLFRLWARSDARVELIIEGPAEPRSFPMSLKPSGMFEAYVPDVKAGTLYWFKIDGAGPYPDPASRWQPKGVHGPSEVMSPEPFDWTAEQFRLPDQRELVFYELHVGTFTPEGNFLAVIEKLKELQQLGINVIELLPVADFAGEYNWGYDGVALYAPAHSYGTPDDLRKLVDHAHKLGMGVCLDVVYNHLGPDGAYHSTFAPKFYSGKHKTPWGDGLNFDGDGREKVRNYFIESALQWVCDFHVDCLRADATHAILDDSQPHFLTELTERVHAAAQEIGRKVLVIAEDERNERRMVLPPAEGGHGFDAVWSDDFHHHIRHRLAGDSDGYFRDFDGTTENIAKTIEQGWFFTGEHSSFSKKSRGTSPQGLSHPSRVFNIQNHDQIGNRAFGDRLSASIPLPGYLAASALLLLAPEIPLIFMGQEWAATEPFQFFTNHNPELGRLVTEGRRKEFEGFTAFQDENHASIPDPQDLQTFLRSKLDWNARQKPLHTKCLRWYERLLRLRRALVRNAQFSSCTAPNDRAVCLEWRSDAGSLYAVVALEGPCRLEEKQWSGMQLILNSEDPEFSIEPKPILWDRRTGSLYFLNPGAMVLANEGILKEGTGFLAGTQKA